MVAKTLCCFVCLLACILLSTTQVLAQTVRIKNSPRPFTVVGPTSWTQQPTTTGNSRIKFVSPVGTPAAECAVIVKENPGLRSIPQSTFDGQMAELPDPNEMASNLSSRFNNAKVLSVGVASISGHPAQLHNVQYSVGTPDGEQWSRGTMVTTMTTPGLSWTVGCSAMGTNLNEALKGYSYWQLEIVRFSTNIKIMDSAEVSHATDDKRWVFLSVTESGLYYYDSRSLSKDNLKKFVRVWTVQYYLEEKHKDLDNTKLLFEINCSERKIRIVDGTMFYKDGTNSHVPNEHKDRWSSILPDSLQERLSDTVCAFGKKPD
jgi:hypothetical protein